jgi:Flp pilus assembly protein CpaB
LLIAAGVAGAVWFAAGKSLFFHSAGPQIPFGKIAVPMSARAIPSYTQVSRSDLFDPKGKLAVIYLSRAELSPRILTGVHQVIGRVLKDEKPAGYVFTEDDFLPKGTRPGLVAGIPAGKRAMRLEADQVKGLHGLAAGDRFDLVATIPIDPKAVQNSLKTGGVYGGQLTAEATLANVQKQATVRVIVDDGTIVQPPTVRQAPQTSRTLTQGTVVRTRPVQEVVIAVDPDEVAALTEALAVGAQVLCVPRSGRPEDGAASPTAERRPRSPFTGNRDGADSFGLPKSFTVVESISGTKRQLTTVPRH